jgi:hypothetical protein
VSGVPPNANAGPDQEVSPGDEVLLDGSASDDPDQGPAPLAYSWRFSSVPPGSALTNESINDWSTAAPRFTPDALGSYVLELEVFDGEASDFDNVLVVVNTRPELGDIAVSSNPAPVETAIDVHIDFTDADMQDTHSAVWDWDDGTMCKTATDVDCELNESGGAGTVTGSHVYTQAGVHTVTVTLADHAGLTDTATTTMVVVYDPEGGFVTGGGWIDSEAGWCQLDALCAGAEGKANFGFVSKYKKGAAEPTGETEFQFGDLNFHSDSYDWLVMNQSGTNAQYEGFGTINGESAPSGDLYRFTLWANDLSPSADDTFRIRIWDEDEVGTEVVIYDNGFDQPINAGSITVHAAKGN